MDCSEKNLNNLLDIAKATAGAASRFAKETLFSVRSVEKDIDRDVKVKADRELESLIIGELQKKSNITILSEEKGLVCPLDAGDSFKWIIDPLDGSLNYSRSIPFFCISIALWDGMKPVLGVIYDLNRDELFYGIVGRGAWLNGYQISVGNIKEKNKAVLCTGFPVKTDFSDKSLKTFITDIQGFKKVRLFGSAALSLAFVASGRADYYREDDIAIWDVAAGIAIVRAAGGNIHFQESDIDLRLNVEASNYFLLK